MFHTAWVHIQTHVLRGADPGGVEMNARNRADLFILPFDRFSVVVFHVLILQPSWSRKDGTLKFIDQTELQGRTRLYLRPGFILVKNI